MDLATIALVLQDEYKIVIDEDDYPKLKTIRLIAEYIEEKTLRKGLISHRSIPRLGWGPTLKE